MSNLVKLVLGVAFAIFVIGFIWAIVIAVKRPNQIVKKPVEKKTEQVAPAPSVTPPAVQPNQVPVAEARNNTPKKPAARPARRPITTTKEIITITSEEVRASAGSDAWATAGVDQYGNAYAEAHAN